jgi:L-serine dehydratase
MKRYRKQCVKGGKFSMDISIFDSVGPLMIGPSSSHTAGAAKLARAAASIIDYPFHHVSFGLHGSFAKTYKGHGTDTALVAGILGISESDERLINAFELAKERGIAYDFYETTLKNVHQNSVKMTFTLADGRIREIVGSSIGGGQIIIRKIDGFDTEVSLNSSTLVILQEDKVGVVSEITKVLADHMINIGVMAVKRKERGSRACCIIETDSLLFHDIVEDLKKLKNIIQVQAINAVN